MPEAERNGDFYSYRAGLLLLVGRADEAEPDIETALRENGNNADALSLKAIIAIVKNDKAKALELANQAVNIDDKSASARIALSYALQANFKIEDALKAAREATLRDADSALAWARVAELELSIPNYDDSKEAAEKAVKLNPNLARTQSVLGFANLTRIDIKAAKENFNKAIELDQADPLPRLGLGLATIRDAKLEVGREQIEIAASLNPESSLIRSYLGKAYYEEKRDTEAGKQFELAKERDPKDPTPYSDHAVLKRGQNDLYGALVDAEAAIERNPNRSVYRSRLLLDRDAVSKDVGLASIYDELGFTQVATLEAVLANNFDPSSYSAHRFLAQTYSNTSRQDIARLSETLQAQIRQPVDAGVIPPQLLGSNLFIRREVIPFSLGWNEYGPLFSSSTSQIRFESGVGSKRTRWGQFVLNGSYDTFGFGIGQLNFNTDGLVTGTDSVRKGITNVLLKKEFPSANVHLDFTRSTLDAGDVLFIFDPEITLPVQLDTNEDVVRLGIIAGKRSNSQILVDAAYERTKVGTKFPFLDEPVNRLRTAHSLELQHQMKMNNSHLFTGFGYFEGTAITQFEDTSLLAYNTNVLAYFKNRNEVLSAQAGLALDYVRLHAKEFDPLVIRRVSPKLGIVVQPNPNTTFRFAAFSSVKRPLVGSKSLEPSNIVGFNQIFTSFDQFFGDPDGTISKRVALALDQKWRNSTYGGVEVSRRKVTVPITFPREDVDWRENQGRLYFYKAMPILNILNEPRKLLLAFRAEYEFEEFKRPLNYTGNEGIVRLVTHRIPLTIKLGSASGWSYSWRTAYTNQRGRFSLGLESPIVEQRDSGWTNDFGIEFKFRSRSGSLELGVKNVFDREIKLRETDPINPSVPTRRFLFGRANLAF